MPPGDKPRRWPPERPFTPQAEAPGPAAALAHAPDSVAALAVPGLPQTLLRSWQRSHAAGLEPQARHALPDNLCQARLQQLREQHAELMAHSLPVLEYLFQQVRPAQGIVVLADASGTLLHALGEGAILDKTVRVALAPGALWSESARGTNAIGTALAEAAAVEVHGSQHFLQRHRFLTCAAAPICNGLGRVLGVLDVSGEHTRHNPYSLGLVTTAARAIENRLLCASHPHDLRLHLHPRAHGIGGFDEAIVVLSDSGQVRAANRSARESLHLQATPLLGLAIERLLGLSLPELLALQGLQAHATLSLRTPGGQTLYAQLHGAALVPPAYKAALPTVPLPAPAPRALRPPSAACPGTGAAHADALAELDSGDARWHAVCDKVRRILDKPIALLIQGETGVGKEWLARAAHASGPRHQQPFVAVNCAALPEPLLEAELFGHAPGAYTGARREGNPGWLRAAHGGTLFLDEIGDMPLSAQSRLLRVLQERQVTPLGSQQPVAVDFFLICATHRPLRAEVEAGRLRADLYYRINGLSVELPPLRERSDFLALTRSLLRSIEPTRPLVLAASLLAALRAYPWPGNLRQYSNVLRTACALLEPGATLLDWQHLADDIRAELRGLATADHKASSAPTAPITGLPRQPSAATHTPPSLSPARLELLTQQAIAQAMQHCRGNISQAARALGISRQTLYRKLESQPR